MRPKLKRLVTAGMTFTVALGAGFLVQYGDALASRIGTDEPAATPQLQNEAVMPIAASALPTPALKLPSEPTESFELAAVTDLPVEEPVMIPDPIAVQPPLVIDKVDPLLDVVETTPILELAPEVEVVDCSPAIYSGELKLAFVQINLDAPCHANMPLTIHHEGMVFSEMTDADGALQVDIPALSQDAFFIVTFDDGTGAITQTSVPSLADYDRSVLQWTGETGTSIHALEFGAGYGEQGHISHDAGGSIASAATGDGGFLVQLGNADVQTASFAEIYTFPSGLSLQSGSVVLNVEAEVSAENCGRSITAQTIQLQDGFNPLIRDLSMTLPDCDAIGEFLVLNNLFEDLTLASR